MYEEKKGINTMTMFSKGAGKQIDPFEGEVNSKQNSDRSD